MFSRAPMGIVVAALLILGVPTLGRAQASSEEVPPETLTAIERLIDEWYAEQCEGTDGRPWRLMAPGGIDASPGYRYPNTGAAVLGRPYPVSLAATTTLFRYEITRIKADPRFAKVQVRERGYRYAGAATITYESMSNALLVLELQNDGRWLVLAHQNNSTGFPSSLATVPMPDLGPEGGEAPEPRCGPFRADEHAG